MIYLNIYFSGVSYCVDFRNFSKQYVQYVTGTGP